MSASHLPSPPFVDIEGIANFRDAGGEKTSNGGNVVTGLIYRSADPSKATQAGLQKMSKELGIKAVFDLRSLPEIRRQGPEWANVDVDQPNPFEPYGIERHWVPVFASDDYGPEQVALRYKEYVRAGTEGFVKAYTDILTSGTDAYTKILRHLAQPKPQPCLYHCTAGKDRTGILTALLLLLAGVDEDTIAEEYSLTDAGLKHLRPLFIERLLKNPALEGNEAGVQNMVSSKKENMLASIDMIKTQFGGAEGYLRDYCKLSDGDVELLKKNLLQAER
ncbi:hypothetical protein AMS68_005453 [Peltaster fructicola]|uniref:Tyrosine specific protein phosphatases domain-containing protein n=1 Tax=Peltaster fructicola TaxID=286661 RepID=A0A6H0XZ26_9PEZI|nr:hypothetical protein AMS68_005453 [Peltaster fructicola]